MQKTKLDGPFQLDETKQINHLVVLLHGYGADGNDLIGLAPFFSHYMKNTAFHAPHGIFPCEDNPFGRQWFSLRRSDPDLLRRNDQTQEVAFEKMYDEAESVRPELESYILSLMHQYKLTHDKVSLIGFSQGTMMALHVGLRSAKPFNAIVGFSGALVGAKHLVNDIKSPCPILLVHGDQDEMLPLHAVELAHESLKKADIAVETLIRPKLPHSIDQEGAKAGIEFIMKQTKKAHL